MDSPRETTGIPVFRGTDFDDWKFRVELLLEEKNVIDRIKIVPTDAVKKEANFAKHDVSARNIIVKCLDSNFTEYVKGKASAYEMWKNLCDTFESKSLTKRIYTFKKLINLECADSKDL